MMSLRNNVNDVFGFECKRCYQVVPHVRIHSPGGAELYVTVGVAHGFPYKSNNVGIKQYLNGHTQCVSTG